MTVDMTKLAAENPEAHAYILQLRGEAAENRVKATEAAASRQAAEAERDQFKAQAEAATAKVTELTTAQQRASEGDLRAAAAKKHGLSDAQAAYVTGTTAEEFETSAAKVAADFGVKPPAEEKKTPPADDALRNPAQGDAGASAPDPEAEEFVQKLLAAHGLAGSESA